MQALAGAGSLPSLSALTAAGVALPVGKIVALFGVAPFLVITYGLFPFGRLPFFRKFDKAVIEGSRAALEVGADKGDTGGIRFSDIAHLKGVEVAPYLCPQVSKTFYAAMMRITRSVETAARRASQAAAGIDTPRSMPLTEPHAKASASAYAVQDGVDGADKGADAGADDMPTPRIIKSPRDDGGS